MLREEERFEKFKEYWRKTEVIREYQRMLFTFGDMKLPYIFVAEQQFRDRAIVRKGTILFEKPRILLPDYYCGPEFQEGFAQPIPPGVTYVFRQMGFPRCFITNKPLADKEIKYGSLQAVLDKFNREMEKNEDTETGLIKGISKGMEPSLLRYSLGLAIKSGPANIKEFFEHMRRQRGEPIRPNEKITDEEIARLFEF